jgi:hypothetical protein
LFAPNVSGVGLPFGSFTKKNSDDIIANSNDICKKNLYLYSRHYLFNFLFHKEYGLIPVRPQPSEIKDIEFVKEQLNGGEFSMTTST